MYHSSAEPYACRRFTPLGFRAIVQGRKRQLALVSPGGLGFRVGTRARLVSCEGFWGKDEFMNITTKMTVYTTCILALVLGLLLTMNYFKYGNILTDVTTSRLEAINKNLEFSLSRATNLGLALEELQFADTLLKRAKDSDPAIREIEVFDLSGKVLFSTRTAAEDSKVEKHIMGLIAPLRKKDTTEWSAHTDEQFVAGVTLYNSFDRSIGGVVLRYDRSGYEILVTSVLEKLIAVTAAVLGIAALVAGIGISLGFRELRHTYAAIPKRPPGRLRGCARLNPTASG